MTNFNEALVKFLDRAQAISDKGMERYSSLTPPTLTTKDGRRYVKVIRDSSVHCFIDKTNGDVLKPASWRAPAKHARGNIFDSEDGAKYMGVYGPAYLR